MGGFGSLFSFIPQLQQQTPSLDQIINQPVTPPFAGGSIPGLQPQQPNPYEALIAILNNLQNQPLYQAPPPSKLDSIINAIAGGVSVLGSKDPSQALAQQLQGRRQERLIKEQAQQERQKMFDQARLQIGVQQAQSLAREQEDIRKEQRQELRYQKSRVEALEDLKKTGIVKQELADLEGERALKFYKDNKATILGRMEDEAYVRSLPERDMKALMLATRWKAVDPASDSALLNELAKKVIRGNEKLSPIERQLYNRLEGLVQVEEEGEREEAKLMKKAQRAQVEAVTEATKSGERYAGQQDRYRNAFEQQQGAQAGKVTSYNFYRNKNDPSIVIDEDQFNKLKGTIQSFDYIPLTEDENVQERSKRYQENAERNKRISQRQNTPQTTTNVTGGDIIDLANDQAGTLVAQTFAQKGLEETRKLILESNKPQQEKLRLLQILERLSGNKSVTPVAPGKLPIKDTGAEDRSKKAQEILQKPEIQKKYQKLDKY